MDHEINSDDNCDKTVCSICHEDISSDNDDDGILCKDCPLTHTFHSVCLSNWIQTNFTTNHKLAGCPICRGHLDIKESVWDMYKTDTRNEITRNNSDISYLKLALKIQCSNSNRLKKKYNLLSGTDGDNREELLEINKKISCSIDIQNNYINLSIEKEQISQKLLYKLFVIDYLYNQTMVSKDSYFLSDSRDSYAISMRQNGRSYETRAREMHIVYAEDIFGDYVE